MELQRHISTAYTAWRMNLWAGIAEAHVEHAYGPFACSYID